MSLDNMYSSSNICSTMGIADTSIRTAGPEGSPLYDIHWLAKEDIENQTQTHNHTHTTNMAHSPPQKLWYLPNHRDALQARASSP